MQLLRGAALHAQVASDLWGTAKFVDSVRLPYIAPSLGGIESLIEQPTVISYWDQARLRCCSCWVPSHAWQEKQRMPAQPSHMGCCTCFVREYHSMGSCMDMPLP